MRRERLLQIKIDVFAQRVGLHFKNEQVAQIRNQVGHEPHHVLAGLGLFVKKLDGIGGFAA